MRKNPDDVRGVFALHIQGDGNRLYLSGNQSIEMTHKLRASHQAILVGIGTVIIDAPQLTVRFAQDPNPQPVVLDSMLRMPMGSYLAARHPLKSWIVTGPSAPAEREEELKALGHRIFRVPQDSQGRLDLTALCATLHANGIKTLMVEGGVEVIDSFLATDLVDRVVITISPRYTGGRRILSGGGLMPYLADVSNLQLGEDIVADGENGYLVAWGDERSLA